MKIRKKIKKETKKTKNALKTPKKLPKTANFAKNNSKTSKMVPFGRQSKSKQEEPKENSNKHGKSYEISLKYQKRSKNP